MSNVITDEEKVKKKKTSLVYNASVLSLWDAICKKTYGAIQVMNNDISKYKEDEKKMERNDERIKKLLEEDSDLLYEEIKNDLENIMKNPEKNINSLVQELKTKVQERKKSLGDFDNILSNDLIKLIDQSIDKYNNKIKDINITVLPKKIIDDLNTQKKLQIDKVKNEYDTTKLESEKKKIESENDKLTKKFNELEEKLNKEKNTLKKENDLKNSLTNINKQFQIEITKKIADIKENISNIQKEKNNKNTSVDENKEKIKKLEENIKQKKEPEKSNIEEIEQNFIKITNILLENNTSDKNSENNTSDKNSENKKKLNEFYSKIENNSSLSEELDKLYKNKTNKNTEEYKIIIENLENLKNQLDKIRKTYLEHNDDSYLDNIEFYQYDYVKVFDELDKLDKLDKLKMEKDLFNLSEISTQESQSIKRRKKLNISKKKIEQFNTSKQKGGAESAESAKAEEDAKTEEVEEDNKNKNEKDELFPFYFFNNLEFNKNLENINKKIFQNINKKIELLRDKSNEINQYAFEIIELRKFIYDIYLKNKKIKFLENIDDNYKELSEYEDEINNILKIINHLNVKILSYLEYESLQINFIDTQIEFLKNREECFKLPDLFLKYLKLNSYAEIDIKADKNEKYKSLNILKIIGNLNIFRLNFTKKIEEESIEDKIKRFLNINLLELENQKKEIDEYLLKIKKELNQKKEEEKKEEQEKVLTSLKKEQEEKEKLNTNIKEIARLKEKQEKLIKQLEELKKLQVDIQVKLELENLKNFDTSERNIEHINNLINEINKLLTERTNAENEKIEAEKEKQRLIEEKNRLTKEADKAAKDRAAAKDTAATAEKAAKDTAAAAEKAAKEAAAAEKEKQRLIEEAKAAAAAAEEAAEDKEAAEAAQAAAAQKTAEEAAEAAKAAKAAQKVAEDKAATAAKAAQKLEEEAAEKIQELEAEKQKLKKKAEEVAEKIEQLEAEKLAAEEAAEAEKKTLLGTIAELKIKIDSESKEIDRERDTAKEKADTAAKAAKAAADEVVGSLEVYLEECRKKLDKNGKDILDKKNFIFRSFESIKMFLGDDFIENITWMDKYTDDGEKENQILSRFIDLYHVNNNNTVYIEEFINIINNLDTLINILENPESINQNINPIDFNEWDSSKYYKYFMSFDIKEVFLKIVYIFYKIKNSLAYKFFYNTSPGPQYAFFNDNKLLVKLFEKLSEIIIEKDNPIIYNQNNNLYLKLYEFIIYNTLTIDKLHILVKEFSIFYKTAVNISSKFHLLVFSDNDSKDIENILSSDSNFKSIIRFNELFGEDEKKECVVPGKVKGIVKGIEAGIVKGIEEGSAQGGSGYSGGKLKNKYQLLLGLYLKNYFKYGLFTSDKNKDIFLGPSKILIGIKPDTPNSYIKKKLENTYINEIIDKEDSDLIIVYGNSSSGKTYLVDNYISKDTGCTDKVIASTVESIQLWNFENDKWDTAQTIKGESNIEKINNEIIRTTFENDHSSRRHKCIKTTDKKYIYDLCGAEKELTPLTYLNGLVDENNKTKTVDKHLDDNGKPTANKNNKPSIYRQIIEDNKNRPELEINDINKEVIELEEYVANVSNFSEHNPFIVIFSKLNIQYSNEIDGGGADNTNEQIKNDVDSKINNFLEGKGDYYITYELQENKDSQYTMMPFFKKYYHKYIENDLNNIPEDRIAFRDTLKNKFNNEKLEMGSKKIDPLLILVDEMDEETYNDIHYKIYKYIPRNIGGDYIEAFKRMFMGHYGDHYKSFDKVKDNVKGQITVKDNVKGQITGTSSHPRATEYIYNNLAKSVKELRKKIKAYIDTNIELIFETITKEKDKKTVQKYTSMIHYSVDLRMKESININDSLRLVIDDMHEFKKTTKIDTPMLPRQELNNIEYQNKFMKYFCDNHIRPANATNFNSTSAYELKFFKNITGKNVISSNKLFINTVDIKHKDTDEELRYNNQVDLELENNQYNLFIEDYNSKEGFGQDLLELSLRDFGIASNLKELFDNLTYVSEHFIDYSDNFSFYNKIWEPQKIKFYGPSNLIQLNQLKNLSYTYKPLIKPNIEMGMYLASIFTNIELGDYSFGENNYRKRINNMEHYLMWKQVAQSSNANQDAFMGSITGGNKAKNKIDKIDKINNELKKIKKLYKSIK